MVSGGREYCAASISLISIMYAGGNPVTKLFAASRGAILFLSRLTLVRLRTGVYEILYT